MDSKSALKKLLAVAEQGAVIKFSMPAGPESDEFYSNLVRKFGQDAVSRTVKENCSAMNPHSKTQTTETVCSLTKIETANDSFYQHLRSTLKEDIDWNFIDFVIDYLLSTDKDGQQAADVDKLIQNYVKLNPQLREQLVAMLKSLAEAKEIRIEPSQETVVIPKRSPKVKTDEVGLGETRKIPLIPKSPSSSRSLKRHPLNLSQVASTRGTSSEVGDELKPEPAQVSSAQRVPESPLCLERLADSEFSKTTMLSKPRAPPKSSVNETESPNGSSPTDCSSKPPKPPAPPPSPRSDPPQVQVGYLRVVGATAKALQLLRSEDHFVDDISLVHTTPRRIDDSDCDEVFKFAGCTYDEFIRLGSAGTAAKKRKKRNKKKNRKKNYSAADEEVPLELEPDLDSRNGASDVTASNSIEDVTVAGVLTEATSHQSLDDYPDSDREHQRLVVSRETCLGEDLCLKNTNSCSHETPSTSCGHTSAVLGKPLRLVRDIESRAPRSLARSDMLLEKELRFQSVSQADPCIVTSWDDLKELVAEVFPNDSELQEAFARKAHNSLDLWRFIVKYGRMYKDFVSEVLEMVNELKKGLIDAMDMHREKTNEILETHKKEMCAVVEKARAADCRIEVLEKELQDHRLLADDQKVKAFTQEEEIQKLQKDVTAKDKKLRDLDNTRKELLCERIKAKEEKERLAAEHEKTKSELLETQSECDSLRSRLKRSREGAEETDYRLRELESKLCDEQIEKEKLKENNAALTKKAEALQKELEKLREKQAQQRKKEMTNKSTSMNPLNLHPPANDSSVFPSRSVSSSSASSSRGSLCSPVISPMSSRCSNSQYFSSLNSTSYASSPERAVGSPSTKMFPQNSRGNQPSLRRPIPFSSSESVGSNMSSNPYGFNTAGNPNDVCGPRLNYRDSAVGKQYSDSEVHSLLTPSESQPELRNHYALPRDNDSRSVFNQAPGPASNMLRGSKSPLGEPTVPASLPSPSFASLFSRGEAPAQPTLPYSPWGNSTFDFSPSSAPLLFDIKPSSLSVTPTGYAVDPMSRFPDSDFRSLSGTPHRAVDQNIPNPNQGFNDPFRF